jgi:hypothetical protein
MNRYDESEDLKQSDTEITLGTSSILGIFIGLALICGIFFGFGYSLGRTHTRASAAAQTAPPQTSAPSPIKTIVEPADGNGAKPAAGAPIPAPALTASTSAPVATPATTTTGQVAPATYNAATPAKPVSAAFTPPAASIMVQIAAVSRPEDATVLVSALKGLGYNASVRSEPTDKLFHVQVGPFATRDEAMAMRAKLINDGYNAILK